MISKIISKSFKWVAHGIESDLEAITSQFKHVKANEYIDPIADHNCSCTLKMAEEVYFVQYKLQELFMLYHPDADSEYIKMQAHKANKDSWMVAKIYPELYERHLNLYKE